MSTWLLHQGDALRWLPRLDGESVDMLLTDPPYSSGGLHKATRSTGSVSKNINSESQRNKDYPEFFGDNRDQRSMLAWCALWLAECWRVLRAGAVAAVFADWRQLPLMTDALQAGGFVWRGLLVWDKTEAARTIAPGYPRHQCEYVVWGTKGELPVRPPGTGLSFPGCLRVPTGRDKVHATEKPLQLLLELIKLAPEEGRVLDPFMGSGSTGVAALRSGRSFIGAELAPVCFALAWAGLEAESAQVDRPDHSGQQMPLLGAP